tara:strand:- start:277 stop:387 length:111 start_codon:yes stop_codon:yes gene_type:complete
MQREIKGNAKFANTLGRDLILAVMQALEMEANFIAK